MIYIRMFANTKTNKKTLHHVRESVSKKLLTRYFQVRCKGPYWEELTQKDQYNMVTLTSDNMSVFFFNSDKQKTSERFLSSKETNTISYSLWTEKSNCWRSDKKWHFFGLIKKGVKKPWTWIAFGKKKIGGPLEILLSRHNKKQEQEEQLSLLFAHTGPV